MSVIGVGAKVSNRSENAINILGMDLILLSRKLCHVQNSKCSDLAMLVFE